MCSHLNLLGVWLIFNFHSIAELLQGANNIVQKLSSLPFQKVQHHISSTDVQPSMSGGIMVFVTGQLLVRLSFRERKGKEVYSGLEYLKRIYQHSKLVVLAIWSTQGGQMSEACFDESPVDNKTPYINADRRRSKRPEIQSILPSGTLWRKLHSHKR